METLLLTGFVFFGAVALVALWKALTFLARGE
jgi:hypothetical protein